MARDITKLHPEARRLALLLVDECEKEGLVIKITDCLRDKAEQDALYAQGRTEPGSIVTNVKYPNSMHNWGVAFDFCRNDGAGAYNESGQFFTRVGAVGKRLGLEWGGDWKSIVDKPHFQLAGWGSTPSKLKQQYGTPEAYMATWPAQEPGWEKSADKRYKYRKDDLTLAASEWLTINNHWYLFGADGWMLTGWHRWNPDTRTVDPVDGSGDWYFLDNTYNGPLEGACWHSRDNGAQEVWFVE